MTVSVCDGVADVDAEPDVVVVLVTELLRHFDGVHDVDNDVDTVAVDEPERDELTLIDVVFDAVDETDPVALKDGDVDTEGVCETLLERDVVGLVDLDLLDVSDVVCDAASVSVAAETLTDGVGCDTVTSCDRVVVVDAAAADGETVLVVVAVGGL